MKIYLLFLCVGLVCLSSCGDSIKKSFLFAPTPTDNTLTTDTTPTCTAKVIMDNKTIL
jgi:hypothetical protein